MNVIVLYAKANLGKTTTLKKTIRVLLEKGYKPEKATDNLEQIVYDKNNKKDVCALFTINGKKVGITTHGDCAKFYDEEFNFLGKCDFNICASRSKGETVERLKKMFNNNIIWLNKDSYEQKNNYADAVELQDEANEIQANYIADLIIKLTKKYV